MKTMRMLATAVLVVLALTVTVPFRGVVAQPVALRGDGVAEDTVPALPLSVRVQLLESAWARHGVVINSRAVLDRWSVYRFLDRDPEFERLLEVRVREALEYDTAEVVPARSARALIWGPHRARRLTDSTSLFEARVGYAAQGHVERYWMRATPGHARPWTVDSITIAGFYYF